LGGIVTRKSYSIELQQKVDRLIRKSIEYAFSNYSQLTDYIRQHSQEMSEEVMRKHIDLYVNNYSIDLGDEGKSAINKLVEVYKQTRGNTNLPEKIFIG
jgi:1,4-dihydroxy-6-naphthoate synthase